MPFNYVIYLMIFISALYALKNGIKKELFCLISSSVSLLFVFIFFGEYLSTIELFKSFILDLKNTCLDFFSIIKVNTYLIDVIAFYVLPFILIYLILFFIFKFMFLNKNKHLKEERTFLSKIGSIIIGMIIGLELSIIILPVLSNIITVEVSGLSEFIIENFPSIKEIFIESYLLR